VSEIDTNSDEFKQAVAEAVASEVEGLKAKNAELIIKNKKLSQGATISPDDLAAAEAERDEWKGKAQAAEKAAKKAATDAEAALKRAEEIDGAFKGSVRDAALTEALAKAGIAPQFMGAAKAMFAGAAEVVDDNGTRKVMVGGKALAEHITEWAASDEGKHFVAAPEHSGGGSHGGRGGQSSADSDITSDDAAKRVAAIQARLDKNPEYVR
jgi:hypothetical protein